MDRAKSEAETMLDAVGETDVFVAAMTGIKQQFINAGWHEHAAERMVYAMMMQNAGVSK